MSLKVKTNKKPIDKKLKKYLDPEHGKCVFFCGGRGNGKTHEIVNYIWHLTQDLGWYVCTNIQFVKTKNTPTCPECGRNMIKTPTKTICLNCFHEEDEGENPPKIHFITKMSDFFKETAEIRKDDIHTPIVLIIDEFHTTVNRLESQKYHNVVPYLLFYMSQMRKFNNSAIFCTQFLKQIPGDLCEYANQFIIKNEKLSNNLTINNESRETKYTSFVIKSQGREVKAFDQYGNTKYVDNKNFKERHINHDNISKVIKQGVVSEVLLSLSCEYNNESRGEWMYRSKGVSVLQFDEINDDDCEWFVKLMIELGRAGDYETRKTILDFFEEYEKDEEQFSSTPFEELSDSRKAVVLHEVSQLTDRESLSKKQAAAIFGVSRQALNAARRNWDDYMIDLHVDLFLADDSVGQNMCKEASEGYAPA